MQKYPVISRHPQALGGTHRCQQHRCSLVHLIARDHKTWVGVSDHPVTLGDRDQLVCAALHGRGRKRVLRGDFGERRKQLTHGRGVLVAAPAQRRPAARAPPPPPPPARHPTPPTPTPTPTRHPPPPHPKPAPHDPSFHYVQK